MYDTSAYWQAQMMTWGPKILIAILILIATWIVARAVKWVIQRRSTAPRPAQARHRPAGGDGRPPARHHRQADHLAGRNHGRPAVPRGRADPCPDQPAGDRDFRVPAQTDRVRLAPLCRRCSRRHRQAFDGDGPHAANVDALLARVGIGSTEGTVRTPPDSVPPGRRPVRPGPASPARPACSSTPSSSFQSRLAHSRCSGSRRFPARRPPCSTRYCRPSRTCSLPRYGSALRSSPRSS